MFPNLWIDAEKCSDGINALRSYRYEVDPDTNQFSKTPLHDQYSHGADAFRYIGLMVNEPKQRRRPVQTGLLGNAHSWMG